MANENKEPYFLLVFEHGDSMPTIISADTISAMYPNKRDQKLIIIRKNSNSIFLENVANFKIVPAEEINFNM